MRPSLPVQVNVRSDDGEPKRGELDEHGSDSQCGRLSAGPGALVSPERPEPYGPYPARRWPLTLHALIEEREPQPLENGATLWFVRRPLRCVIRISGRRA